jgi:pimeloyl-ACP methyl ester carboxylesterase
MPDFERCRDIAAATVVLLLPDLDDLGAGGLTACRQAFLPTIRTPALITHGADEAIVKPSAVDPHRTGLPHTQVQMIANAGHAVFWDDATGFNARRAAFAASV